MYCEKCGAKIPQNSTVCECCGNPVPYAKATDPAVEIKPERRRKMIPMLIAFALVVGVGIGAIAAYFSHNSEARYVSKMESAQKYVQDGDIESAVSTYEEAISIKPKEEDAYIELADVYSGQDDYYMAIRTLERGLDNTGSKETFEKHIKDAQIKLDGSWKSAYTRILEENRAFIEFFETDNMINDSVVIHDVNGDDIPELIFFAAEDLEENYFGLFNVFTFSEGKVKPVKVIDKNDPLENDSDYKIFFDYATKYAIFCEKKTGRMVLYNTNYGDPGYEAIINEIEIDKKGKSKVVSWMRGYMDGVDFETGHAGANVYKEFYINGKGTTEADYRKGYEALRDTMDENRVLFLQEELMGERTATIPPDEEKIWEMASKKGPLAMSCAEALEELKTAGN